MRITFTKIFPFLIICLLALPLILPFLKRGFFITHDGEWAIVRLTAYHFALKDGQIPPRWAGNLFHSYGYPVLNFNYPLPPMIGEMFHLIGFSFVDSVKAVFVLSIVLSAIFIYLLTAEVFGQITALFGVILYLYYPFRMADLFVRGSVGESLAFACLPLVYWSLVKLRKHGDKKWLAIAAISLACLILAHNSIAFVSLPFVIAFMIYELVFCPNFSKPGPEYSRRAWLVEEKRKLFSYFIVSLLLAFGLSYFFWLPALWEKQWTILKPEIITKPTEHFLTVSELIIPSWGYGRSKTSDSLSFQLGLVHLLLFLVSFPFLFAKKDKIGLFFLLAALVNIFFLLPISTPLWQELPLMAFVSYPWRLLVPIGFYFSVIGSFVFSQFFPPPALPESVARQFLHLGGVPPEADHRPRWSLGSLAILFTLLILFLLSKDYRRPLAFIDKPDMFYITNQSTTIEGDENTPVWVKIPPKQAPKEKIEVSGEYKIEKQKSNLLEFSLNVTQPQKVIINTIYYPGWQVFVDSKKVPIDYQHDLMGRLVFGVEEGKHQVRAVFGKTPLRLAADLVSLASLVVTLCLLL